MLATWLALDVVGASPALHAWLHSDSASPDHHCVISLLAHGKVHQAPADSPVPPPPHVTLVAATERTGVVVDPDYRLLPSRAPPLALS
jgi:hypothetical protein